MAYKTKQQEQKKISVAEFKAWIKGFEELNEGKNWAPTAEQWKKIRAKLDLVEDTTPAPTQVTPQPIQEARPARPPMIDTPSQLLPQGPAVMQRPPSNLIQPPSNLPQAPRFASTVPMLTQDPGSKTARLGQAPVVKTPDIDTTNGQYVSSFA